MVWTERCAAHDLHVSNAPGGTLTPAKLEAFLGSGTPTSIGVTKGTRGGQQELRGHLEELQLSSSLQHRHQARQKNLPTNRTSRSDFTGLLLNVFSTGHSFSWLHAQTLDALLSCKNTTGFPHTSSTANTQQAQAQSDSTVCIFAFLE